ncbi:hypothetical protein [Tautonia plasticadhaerens]|uniref:Uncharacterized protein n=1 Tax=Tautonia plasticadhaerens TaxID=2527974 RepID=A0A518HAD8_9BACT|nr:hypothetical protein [Tautonia plasticadhaerens]QDV37818.1 hypothetical protein ElP_57650 [Tautonia plasticadhaerens]
MVRPRSIVPTLALAASLGLLGGCGGGADVEQVEMSPEAKKADTAGQDAMREYMSGPPKGQ